MDKLVRLLSCSGCRARFSSGGVTVCSPRTPMIQMQQGIRMGNVKDGKVVAFIPLTDPAIGAAEEVAVDDQGNVFAGFTVAGKTAVRKFVKN